MIQIYIRDPAFTDLLNGQKKYELRLLKGIFKNLSIGDYVLLCNKNKKINKEISNILLFDNFNKLLANLGITNCLVNHTNILSGKKYINTIH